MTIADAVTQPPARPNNIPLLNDFPAYRSEPLDFWLEAGKVAPISRVRFGPSMEYWVVTDPDLMQHVLQKQVKIYPRERRLMSLGGKFQPELMFNTAHWDEWLWRRRLMQPAFHRKQIAHFAEVMVAETAKLADEWTAAETLSLQDAMKTLTMRIIGRTMFSADVGHVTDKLQHDFETISTYTYTRASSFLNPPKWLPLPLTIKAFRADRSRIGILRDIVQARFDSNEPQGDLLDMLIGAHLEDDDRTFSAEQLVYEMAGIVFAGHETTALTMTWLLYQLSQQPEIEAKLQAEIDTVLGDRTATLADMAQMPYTDMLVQETLRYYPPVYVTIREAMEDDQYGDYDIPRGTSLLLNIRGLHHDARFWDAPERFDPERFSAENSAKRPKNVYLPFITGPKKCIGDQFAMMEMRLAVPTLLQKWRFHYAGDQLPNEKPGFVMEADNGVPVALQSR